MIKYSGFGISQTILEKLSNEGIKLIRIIYLGKKGREYYLATTQQYLESEKTYLNENTDLQKFVNTEEMLKW